ncbi:MULTISPECIES: family 16 glycosylhydrolase [unclassified Methylobacterium]|uniref:family 16 glycosylhydrolase n=1 Tax=unclassified Methylobacterium TaxID=2615210 RepID=UPI0011C20E14|nr:MULTISPECIES: family 16 glycosylhydrolase [unclassified Methylobacterium]QEE38758.1 glycoside hydrolase family 16 protein [Methylobacterium sp. WL1]TXN57380.1 glycoside hydrolase family 16 protein [Methylobacterium sp. WL2]
MPIDPKNLAQTATLTYSAEFDTLQLWNGTSGLDTAGGPQWGSYVTATGTRPFNQEQEWYLRADHLVGGSGAALPNPFGVHDGILTITAAPSDPALLPDLGGQPYTSGMINTSHSFSQTYGYFEMRAELPAGQGMWPAFWLLSKDGSWPPEIDVMEMLGHDSDTLYTSVHSLAPGQTAGDHTLSQGTAHVADMSGGFHTYGVDWGPDSLAFYFDGQEVYRTPTPASLDKPMYMIANLAVGGTWPGDADATTPFPAHMNIDYLRAYQANPSSAGASLEPVFHFYDASTGQHLYTASTAERDTLTGSQTAYAYQGVGWAAPTDTAGTADVFHFTNAATGDHFYTASAAERDGLIGSGSGYRYDGVAFEAYTDPSAPGSAAMNIERFVNTESGRHYYASSAAEITYIEKGHAGTGWIDEGHAFTLHAPTQSMFGL